MTQEIEHQGNELRLSGTLTVRLAADLHRAALALVATTGDVVVHCGAVEHADASVLQVLVALHRALALGSRRLTIMAPPPELGGWARLAGLNIESGSAG